MKTFDRERLLLVLDHHLVHAAGFGFAGPTIAHRRAGQRLQFERHVLQHVAHPGAGAEPLEEPAPLADRAAVLDHARQPGHEPLVEPGERVRGKVFEPAEIDPGFEAGKRGPLVGTAEDLERRDLHGSFVVLL